MFLTDPTTSMAGPPTDQIKATVDNAVGLLREARHKPAAINDRRDQLKQILFTRFDFSEMARRALGAHWRRRTASEQQELISCLERVQDSFLACRSGLSTVVWR